MWSAAEEGVGASAGPAPDLLTEYPGGGLNRIWVHAVGNGRDPRPYLNVWVAGFLKVPIGKPDPSTQHMVDTHFDELTSKRQKVVKGLATVEYEFADRERYEDGEFARSQANAAFRENDLTKVLDEDDEEGEQSLETTTDLLNKIQEEDGYLEKTQQGGGSAFVIDTEAEEERGETVTGVTASDLAELASQVLDRHNVTADLSDVDFNDWREVIQTVNRLVGDQILMVKSEPNLYRLTDEARAIVHEEL